jgi:hypothetical protein
VSGLSKVDLIFAFNTVAQHTPHSVRNLAVRFSSADSGFGVAQTAHFRSSFGLRNVQATHDHSPDRAARFAGLLYYLFIFFQLLAGIQHQL